MMRIALNVALATITCTIIATASDTEDAPVRTVPGWGTYEDWEGLSDFSFDGGVLTLQAPNEYVDNYPRGRMNAPRVERNVTGDFTANVHVLEVETAEPNSVHPDIGGFPTAFHAGSLLIRVDDGHFIRFEQTNMNTRGTPRSTCEVQVWKGYERLSQQTFNIKDQATDLRMERKANRFAASYSQDHGKTWKAFKVVANSELPAEVTIALSMTSNTAIGCKVRFKDFRVVNGK